eukprot:3987078-Lingulodinium_polyedra.AAC.1
MTLHSVASSSTSCEDPRGMVTSQPASSAPLAMSTRRVSRQCLRRVRCHSAVAAPRSTWRGGGT